MSDFWTEDDEKMKAAFVAAGYWPNQVLWSVWCQAWKGGGEETRKKLEQNPK